MRQEMVTLDPLLPVAELRSTAKVVDDFLLPQRGLAEVLKLLGASAAILAVLGVYALTTFFVSRRVKEIAVRRSLGATVGTVKTMIVINTLKMAGWGVLVGVVGGFGLSQILGSFLFGVGAFDWVSYVIPVMLMVSAAGFSGYLAARQVSRIEPIEVLRA
jgi:ABC-type antimicrobial peptide transport system permease subunit